MFRESFAPQKLNNGIIVTPAKIDSQEEPNVPKPESKIDYVS